MRTGEAAASLPQAPPHEAEAASSSPGTRMPMCCSGTQCAELPGPGRPKPRDPVSDLLLTRVTAAAAAAQSPQGRGKGRAALGSHEAPGS